MKEKCIRQCWLLWQCTDTSDELNNLDMEWLAGLWEAIFTYHNIDVFLPDEFLDEVNSIANFKNYSKFRDTFLILFS